MQTSIVKNGQHCIYMARTVYESLLKSGGLKEAVEDIERRRKKNAESRSLRKSTSAPELHIIISDTQSPRVA